MEVVIKGTKMRFDITIDGLPTGVKLSDDDVTVEVTGYIQDQPDATVTAETYGTIGDNGLTVLFDTADTELANGQGNFMFKIKVIYPIEHGSSTVIIDIKSINPEVALVEL